MKNLPSDFNSGGADKVFAVIEKYGNKAGDFIWNNSGALMLGTLTLAFYNNPEAFINRTKKLGMLIQAPLTQIAMNVGKDSIIQYSKCGFADTDE